jgi:aspartyl-tRNA(Asn)/glutamyl-tRNA(Gln) amidotransferase subunit A
MPDYTVQQLREGLDKKEFSVSEIAEQYAKRIEETNAKLNSFLTVVDKEHRTEHEEHAQKEINAGNQSALTGIPYAAKDLFSTRGIRTTAGSKILEHFVPAFSATAIEKARDGILLGKTNTDEFALGSSTENSAYGPTRNPFDLTRVAGGTSGGSAAAVAAGQVPFAFGTDTGGSIRLPAAYCNVVGFKPTYGRISRYGVVSAASSLDTVGTLTRNVADAAYLLNQFAGQDPHDGTSAQAPVEDYSAGSVIVPRLITW